METVSFARGVPSPDALPVEDVRWAAGKVLDDNPAAALSYGTGAGLPALRELVAERHQVSPDQVVVTNGSIHALAYLLDICFSGKGGTCVVERPTYDRTRVLAARAGAELREVASDDEGMDVDELADLLQREEPALVYSIPNFHNPLGVTLSEARRVRLAQLVESTTTTLLYEDDPYGELWFEQAPPRSLRERIPERVVYASSFSKTVAPGLRVGYLVVPAGLAPELALLATNTTISANMFSQSIVAQLWASGRLERNVARVRDLLRDRRDALCDSLEELLPECRFRRPGGGYFLWLELPDGLTASALASEASDAGVTFVPGQDFGPGCEASIRLAYSPHPPDEIRLGVERLASAVAAARRGAIA